MFTATLVVALSLPMASTALHGPADGHLLGGGSFGAISLVGALALPGAADDTFGDAAILGELAFVARVAPPCAAAGVHIVDVSDPATPSLRGTIPLKGSFASGGLAALRLAAPTFTGDVLVVPQEACDGKDKKSGGVVILDVTDAAKPKVLASDVGDAGAASKGAHAVAAVAAWTSGGRAFAALADLDEGNVDLVEITDPKKPRLVSELSAPAGSAQPSLGLSSTAARGVTVSQLGASVTLAVAFDDAGFALFDVAAPHAPVSLLQTDYPPLDPQLLERTGVALTPEGNAHRAAFSHDGARFLGVDLDLAPHRLAFTVQTGPHAGEYAGEEVPWTPSILTTLPDGKLDGPTVYGGYGCVDDRASTPSASTIFPSGSLAPGEETIIVLQRGPTSDPSHPHADCALAEKVETAQLAGYDGVIIANDHVGSGAGAWPDEPAPTGSATGSFAVPAATVGHRALHLLFGTAPGYEVPYAAEAMPIGLVGERVAATPLFDGWGYVTLYETATGAMLDTFAPSESHDASYAIGFGALSARHVAMDEAADVAFTTWGSAGLRMLAIDPTFSELTEVGGYLGPSGNDLHSVHAWRDGGAALVLAVDRDWGILLFQA